MEELEQAIAELIADGQESEAALMQLILDKARKREAAATA